MDQKFVLTQSRKIADEFLEFVNRAVSPFHAVQQGKHRLSQSGFKEIHQNQNWELSKGGQYYFTRNATTLVAFTVGNKFDGNKTGFKIVGAHTDSPVLRLAPISKLSGSKFRQTCVNTYGGGLWHTWFDRELSLAGRVIFKDETTKELKHTLFRYDKPLFKIPNLAIHLKSGDEREKFSFNNETHLRPVFSSEVYDSLTDSVSQVKSTEGTSPIQKSHYGGLLALIERETKIKRENVVDLELSFFDTQPASYFGLNDEFISSPRLDNLFSTFHAIRAIENQESFDENSSFINMVVCFDHEECGSESFQGAQSAFLLQTLERIFQLLTAEQKDIKKDSIQTCFLNSFIISADMAHGIHPNYSDKHQVNHKVGINQGIVLQINPNQRYSTDSVGSGLIKAVADIHKVPIQEFVVQNDSPCGTTIGPIVSSGTGIQTIDVGAPQWGMHSIRQTCGVLDSLYYERLFVGFFKDFQQIPQSLSKF